MALIRSDETLKNTGTFDLSSVQTVLCKSGIWLRDWLSQEDEVDHHIPLTSGRVWNAIGSGLPGTATGDDLGINGGTDSGAFDWGVDTLTARTIDQKANGTPTASYGVFEVSVPKEWVNEQTLLLRISGGMVTTVSDTTATVDAEVHKSDGSGGVGSDLCATAAQSINTLLSSGETARDFVITTTTLSPADKLMVRVAVTIEDGATATAVIGAISHLSIRADIKG